MRVLLTVLGTRSQSAVYGFGGSSVEAKLAPLALIQLLPEQQRPERVLALCTKATEDTWAELKCGLPAECEPVRVELGRIRGEDEEVKRFVDKVVTALLGLRDEARGPLEVVFDVTHGFRHFSFLTYAVMLYLSAFGDVRVVGAYYGQIDVARARSDGVSPFLDLAPLLELPRWVYAVQTLEETRSALPLAKLLGAADQNARRLSNRLRSITRAFLAGLPLELGDEVEKFRKESRKPLRKLLAKKHRLPQAEALVDRLSESLDSFALPSCEQKEANWKKGLVLGKEELARQARVLDALIDAEEWPAALGLMNEWTVSWAVWRSGEADGWLNYHGSRRRAAARLGALAERFDSPTLREALSKDQEDLARFWSYLCSLRNALHHHGMRSQEVLRGREWESKRTEVLGYWRETLRKLPDDLSILPLPEVDAVLVSPLGHSVGVLYSAALAVQERTGALPGRCLIVCSPETRTLATEPLRRAGFEREPDYHVLEDAYADFAALDRLPKEMDEVLAASGEVYVNLTGGTTLLGLLADRVGRRAEDLGRTVSRFALVDQRPSEEQRAKPYVRGRAIWLGGDEAE